MNKKWKTVLIISIIGNLFVIWVAYKALDYRRHVNYFLDKYTDLVSDLSGRQVYTLENYRLIPDKRVDSRIVFIGTQITSGWELGKYFPQYEVINRGISGQKLAGYLLRFQPDVIKLKPKAVVIEFSSYNFRPEDDMNELKDYLISMADIAQNNKIEPILTTVIPVGRDIGNDLLTTYNIHDSLIEFNRWLVDYCQQFNIKYVDFYNAVSDRDGFLVPENANGQILLSPAGYEKISEATLKIIRQVIDIDSNQVK